jgi:hypothetical protein
MVPPEGVRHARSSGGVCVRSWIGKVVRGLRPRDRFVGAVAALFVAFAAAGVLSALGAARTAAADSEGRVRVAFVGDSISDGYWEGVSVTAGRDSCLKSLLEIGRFAKNSTGLTRPDRFDWVAELRRIGESFKPRLFLLSLGLNDRQSVVEHGQITMDDSPLYDDKYKERITAVLAAAAAAKASVLWIGLPAMRAPATDKDAREKNRLYEEAITSVHPTSTMSSRGSSLPAAATPSRATAPTRTAAWCRFARPTLSTSRLPAKCSPRPICCRE